MSPPCPPPSCWQLEWCLASFDRLLLGGFDPQFFCLALTPFHYDCCRFILRILRDEAALDGELEDGLAELGDIIKDEG